MKVTLKQLREAVPGFDTLMQAKASPVFMYRIAEYVEHFNDKLKPLSESEQRLRSRFTEEAKEIAALEDEDERKQKSEELSERFQQEFDELGNVEVTMDDFKIKLSDLEKNDIVLKGTEIYGLRPWLIDDTQEES